MSHTDASWPIRLDTGPFDSGVHTCTARVVAAGVDALPATAPSDGVQRLVMPPAKRLDGRFPFDVRHSHRLIRAARTDGVLAVHVTHPIDPIVVRLHPPPPLKLDGRVRVLRLLPVRHVDHRQRVKKPPVVSHDEMVRVLGVFGDASPALPSPRNTAARSVNDRYDPASVQPLVSYTRTRRLNDATARRDVAGRSAASVRYALPQLTRLCIAIAGGSSSRCSHARMVPSRGDARVLIRLGDANDAREEVLVSDLVVEEDVLVARGGEVVRAGGGFAHLLLGLVGEEDVGGELVPVDALVGVDVNLGEDSAEVRVVRAGHQIAKGADELVHVEVAAAVRVRGVERLLEFDERGEAHGLLGVPRGRHARAERGRDVHHLARAALRAKRGCGIDGGARPLVAHRREPRRRPLGRCEGRRAPEALCGRGGSAVSRKSVRFDNGRQADLSSARRAEGLRAAAVTRLPFLRFCLTGDLLPYWYSRSPDFKGGISSAKSQVHGGSLLRLARVNSASLARGTRPRRDSNQRRAFRDRYGLRGRLHRRMRWVARGASARGFEGGDLFSHHIGATGATRACRVASRPGIT